MHEVNVGHKILADYRSIVPPELMAEIDELAAGLHGKRVLHVNATAFGGGVAEILYTLVPLASDAGLPAEWRVITAPPEFYNVTKSFHNGLQGHAVDFPVAARELYESVCRANAAELTRAYDFVVIHDPQPLVMRDYVTLSQDRSTWWIWRCHIDTSTPDEGLYDYLLPSINRYDVAVYTLRDYVPQGLTVPVREIAPTIDPLAPVNMKLSAEDAAYIVRQFGSDVGGSRCRSRTASPGISSSPRPSVRSAASRCWRSPRSAGAWPCWARSTCAVSSSRRGFCATTSGSSLTFRRVR
jgi:trehalose synthase